MGWDGMTEMGSWIFLLGKFVLLGGWREGVDFGDVCVCLCR